MNWLARIGAGLGLCLALAGCVAEEVWAPDVVVSSAQYAPEGQPSVTLITVINSSNGTGAHSALVIDGAERVVFDPAGSWRNPAVPERNDVLYGMNPAAMDLYTDFHARTSYHIVMQEVDVTPEVAAFLTREVESHGAVPQAQCSLSISSILARAPGFENMRSTWFPKRMMNQFAELDGVRTREIYDDDSDNNTELLRRQARALRSQELAAELTAD